MLFSIIVPVYNVAPYVRKTIGSILAQNYISFELILVDDGSTDGSGEICNSYISKDNRVKVIHKKNEGVSSARNTGIDRAVGDYILFVDGDDLMEDNTLKFLNDCIENKPFKPDIIFSNYRYFRKSPTNAKYHYCNYDVDYIENCNNDELCVYLFRTLTNFRCSIWSHVYRSRLIKEKGIYFDTRLIMSEDMDWMLNIILRAQNVTAMNDSIYLYRTDNDTSAMHQPASIKKYESNYLFHIKWFSYFLNNYNGVKSKEIMISLIAIGYINTATSIYNIKVKQEREHAVGLFKKNSHIVRYANSRKYKILFPIKKVFGDRIYLIIINNSHKFKYRYKEIMRV